MSLINWMVQIAANIFGDPNDKALQCANAHTTEQMLAGKENNFIDNYQTCQAFELWPVGWTEWNEYSRNFKVSEAIKDLRSKVSKGEKNPVVLSSGVKNFLKIEAVEFELRKIYPGLKVLYLTPTCHGGNQEVTECYGPAEINRHVEINISAEDLSRLKPQK